MKYLCLLTSEVFTEVKTGKKDEDYYSKLGEM